jgi:hypothetical protein
MNLKNSYWGVALLAAILFIPFLGHVHLFDWDEINFAESAREMLVTGEYFRVQINFIPFWEKPPLFFWLQAACMKVFGVNEFAARLPNALCGIVTLSLLFSIGKSVKSVRFGWLWVLFMCGSFTPALYYKSGIIDPWFNLFIFFAIWQLSLVTTEQNRSKNTLRFLYIGISLGLAVLTKGPVALLITGLSATAFWALGGFRFFFTPGQVLLSVVSIIAISSLWVAVEIQQNGWQVLAEFIHYQIDLFKNPVAGHGQPWYYHVVILLFGCFPASILAIKGFATKAEGTYHQQLKKWMMVLFWVVLVVFSSVTTKIVHYSSMCWIPLTFMAAIAADSVMEKQATMPKYLLVLFGIIGVIIGLLLMAITKIDLYKERLLPYIKDKFALTALSLQADWNGLEWLIGFVSIIVIIFSVVLLWQQIKSALAIYGLLSVQALVIPLYLYWVVPQIEAYSQRPAIEFYKKISQQDCYAETLGMKSYAQYFYTQCTPFTRTKHPDVQWLVFGDIDKPAYFVSKIDRVDELKGYGLTEIGRQGGFIFWLRQPAKQ